MISSLKKIRKTVSRSYKPSRVKASQKRVVKKKVSVLGQKDRYFEAQMNKCVLEAFGGVKEVKITHSEKFFMDDYYYWKEERGDT